MENYLERHRGARREWAPEQGEQALGLEEQAPEAGPLAKTFHEHFSDLEQELKGLVTGRTVVTRDRVAAEAQDLAKRSSKAMDRHIDKVLDELQDEVGYYLSGGINVDPKGRLELKPEQRTLADAVRERKELLAKAQELADGTAWGKDQLEAEVNAVLHHGLPSESAPVLGGSSTVRGLRSDVTKLRDWVVRQQGRGELPKEKIPPNDAARVRQIREARKQRAELQAALPDMAGPALAERMHLTLVGRQRERPEEFPDWAFQMLSRERQDEVLRHAPRATAETRKFAYPYPEPPVPIPVLEGKPWTTPRSSCRR